MGQGVDVTLFMVLVTVLKEVTVLVEVTVSVVVLTDVSVVVVVVVVVVGVGFIGLSEFEKKHRKTLQQRQTHTQQSA